MIRLLAVCVVVAGVAGWACAQATVPYTQQFPVDADTGVYSGSRDHVNVGGRGVLRAAKAYQETVLMDWDSAPIVSWISTNMTAYNISTLQSAIDKGAIKVQLLMTGPSWQTAPVDKSIWVTTVLSPDEWRANENAGTDWDLNYAWPYDPFLGAGNPYAVTTWGYADSDTANWGTVATPWHDPQGNVVTNIRNLPGTTNTAVWGGTGVTLLMTTTPTAMQWNRMPLDAEVWRSLLYNVQTDATGNTTNYNCVGLRTVALDTDWDNWSLYARGQWGTSTAAPRMEITMTPYPGDTTVDGLVDVADLAALAANYGLTPGATWAQGDFTLDGAVDVADLAILAANYGWTPPPPGAAVPEPLTVLLLAGGALWLKRRRT